MAASTDNLERIVRYEADTTQAIRQVDKLTDAVNRNAQQMDSIGAQLESFGNKLDIGGAFYVVKDVIGQVTGAIQGMIDKMDDLGNAAQSIGVNVEVLQGYQYALLNSGVKADETTKALSRLAEQISKIDDPLSNSARLLREMGVTASDTADTALAKISDAFAQAEDGTNKTAVAVQLFGKEMGTKLVPALNGGAQSLNDATQELRDLGIITEEDTQKASEFNASVAKMEALASSLGVAIVGDLLPAMNQWLSSLYESIKAGDLWARSWQTYKNWAKGFWSGDSGASPMSYFAKEADAAREAAKAGQEWEQMTRQNAAVLAQFGAAAGEAKDQAGLPAAQLTELQKWEQQILQTGKAAELVPQKIAYLREQIKSLDASTAEGKSKLEAYTKALKQLEDRPVKAGGGSRKQEIDEFQRWLESLGRSEEAVANVDRKVEYLQESLAKLKVAGEGSSEWAKTLQKELDKLKPPDAVAQALAKINKEVQAQQDNEKVIAGLTAELDKMALAGQGASEYALLLHKRLLDLESAKDPVARVTLELEKLRKTTQDAEATNEELWRRLGTDSDRITGREFEQLYQNIDKGTTSMQKMDKASVDLSDSIAMQLGRSVTDFTDDLVDNMGKAQSSVADFVESAIKSLAKLVLNSYWQQLAKAWTNSGGFSGVFGGGAAAKGAAWDAQGVEYMASGGILGGPTLFSNRGRLAVAGEAGPEAVVPLRRTAGGDLGVAAAPVNVQVNNYTSSEVTTSESTNVDGQRMIQIEIRKAVKAALSDGSMDRTMRWSYGLTRQPSIG